ncbi:Acetyl esterase/lipase [Geosmithia morbida]|uniref:Acetyl esterase/lipase n=1 Tax=Geosmithia morbida TaxID=1094350 RepID=A0A9P5D6F7_9HYPO|nr:Acetyl esterase/lipase [Geosmithia morbida]KAF4125566.1 Acetyl esterase/lipase [Geosmithia morbida]
MPKLNTTSVSMAVTPTVVETLFSHVSLVLILDVPSTILSLASPFPPNGPFLLLFAHPGRQYLNRGPRKGLPTAHLSYDEGIHLIRTFLEFSSHHTVEELQAFTSQWVPHPQWVKVENVTISEASLARAASLLETQLDEDGIRRVGGRKWWQWRRPGTQFEAEWIEMRSDANERKKNADGVANRVMMYVHGGAYFFGSVDEHRYQMQRHARKLQARVFAPRYRLAPQFPFPCGLHDCIASYLHLLETQDPSHIVLAGDSAGGGMIMSLLCILRDQGVPLPAGAILISPWVDLTHSFPSISQPAPLDYIPEYGFHHKPSKGWPPPNEDDGIMLKNEAAKKRKGGKRAASGTAELQEKIQGHVAPPDAGPEQDTSQIASGGIVTDPEKLLTVTIDGEEVRIKDQIQLYTTNELLDHPLVSPVLQPTLGGLPPLLIMTGGGEILRDEQIYLAHKCAHPEKYAPPAGRLDEKGRELLATYEPTDVQLQVWDDLCHVAPTLSFTRPAKFMYRSAAQFGAWCLARAQKLDIKIIDDDLTSESSSSDEASDHEPQSRRAERQQGQRSQDQDDGEVGKAGDPLPKFKDHMIRQRVDRHGVTFPLAKEEDLQACCVPSHQVGSIREAQVQKWLTAKRRWDTKYSGTKAKVYKKIIDDMAVGYVEIPGESPPPSALVGRWRVDTKDKTTKTKQIKSLGLAVWSLWGSRYDEAAVERQRNADPEGQKGTVVDKEHGEGARSFGDITTQEPATTMPDNSHSRGTEATSIAGGEEEKQQWAPTDSTEETTPVSDLLARRRRKEAESAAADPYSLLPNANTGATGKRPFIEGIAMPFTIKKEADTASMVTLNSSMSPALTGAFSPAPRNSGGDNAMDR